MYRKGPQGRKIVRLWREDKVGNLSKTETTDGV